MKAIPGNSTKSIYEIMQECALSKNDEIYLKIILRIEDQFL